MKPSSPFTKPAPIAPKALAIGALALGALSLTGCVADGSINKKGVRANLELGQARGLQSAQAPDGIIQAVPMPSAPLDRTRTLSRIVFASCAQQNEDQSLWNKIADAGQDITLYIGDNVYGDVRSNDPALPELKAAYMRLAQSEPFAKTRAAAPMLTVWDDHDYGLNDAGANYPYREDSQKLFNYVWDVPAESPRHTRPGIYDSWILGKEGKRVQIIMLDTRYFRSDLKDSDERGAPGKERYVPDTDPAKTMLGDAQWAWLAEELKKPAELRLLVSSIQVIADGHGWEAWRTLPLERDKLYRVIKAANVDNLVVLSGDRHAAGLYQRDDVIGAPLVEVTSSSVNLPAARWREQSGETRIEDGPYRLETMIYEANYGTIDIDWTTNTASFAIRGSTGESIQNKSIAF